MPQPAHRGPAVYPDAQVIRERALVCEMLVPTTVFILEAEKPRFGAIRCLLQYNTPTERDGTWPLYIEKKSSLLLPGQ